MEFFGLPLHPLVVHAAVVLTPLAVTAVWVFAFLPSWRWLTRWVALGLTVVATGSVVAAKLSGDRFYKDRFEALGPSPLNDQINTHYWRGYVLLWVMIALLVLVVLAFRLLPAPGGPKPDSTGFAGRSEAWVGVVVPGVLLVAGAVALVYVVLTGDAGARAVWG